MTGTDAEMLKIVEIIGGSAAVSSEDGLNVFDLIKGHLENGRNVEINYDGIDLIVSSFQNAAVGQLYGVFEESKIKSSLKVTNLSPEDVEGLKKVVERAKQYFSDKDGTEKAIKESLDNGN